MAPSLVLPQGRLSPAEALQVAQQAPKVLSSNAKSVSASPLQFLFSSPETAELWTIYENLLLSCLRAGDDDAAHQCLERLVIRFGDKNERVMAMKGLIKEAEAADDDELEDVLNEYEAILEGDGSIIVGKPFWHSSATRQLTFQSPSLNEESPCYDRWGKLQNQLPL